jgi:uncharacterized protein YdgA (DUF945 family)
MYSSDPMQAKKIGRSPWQSFLDMYQQGQQPQMGGQDQQQQQQKGPGLMSKVAGFFL